MAGVEFVRDVTPAAWIAGRLNPFLQDTGSVVPSGFAAYARLFHPVDVGDGSGRTETWREIAARNGRVVHPEMQLHCINHPPGTPAPEHFFEGVSAGSLPARELTALTELLRPHTTTPDRCWFAVWDGFGGLDTQGVTERVRVPHRNYVLYRGPIEHARTPLTVGWTEQSPNLWWPEDGSWVVVTEIDYAWTYLGASRALVDAVLADDRLEALPARLTDQPFFDADRINAALD